MNRSWDVIIVGAGPAGISAGIELVRHRVSALVMEKRHIGGQALAAHTIYNYPAYPNGVSGHELMKRFEVHAYTAGVNFHMYPVVEVEREGELFLVRTPDEEFESPTLIVASGLVPKPLGLPNESILHNRFILYYPEPNWIDATEKKVVVVGSGEAALDISLNFARRAASVDVLVKYDSPKGHPSLLDMIENSPVTVRTDCDILAVRPAGSGVAIIVIEHGEAREMHADVMIVCAGKEPQFPFIPLRWTQEAPPGLFFAGDCRHTHQGYVVSAAAEGVEAALLAVRHIGKLEEGSA